MVGEDGFEPSKRNVTDLQSAPFGLSGTPPFLELHVGVEPTTCWLQVSCSAIEPMKLIWWKQQGSNLWPSACKADALPAELCFHKTKFEILNGGGGRIRTIETKRNRFTVCPLWPLGNSPIWSFMSESNQQPADYKSAALPLSQWSILPNFNSINFQVINGGGGRIRTIETKRNRFTVCPLWPLGNSPIFVL